MQMHISSSLQIRNPLSEPYPSMAIHRDISLSSPRGDNNEHLPAPADSLFWPTWIALLGLQTNQPTQSMRQNRDSICSGSRHLAG